MVDPDLLYTPHTLVVEGARGYGRADFWSARAFFRHPAAGSIFLFPWSCRNRWNESRRCQPGNQSSSREVRSQRTNSILRNMLRLRISKRADDRIYLDGNATAM